MRARYVEILGTDFRNKGAELMLHAVLERLAYASPPVRPVLSAQIGTFTDRAQVGLYHRIALPRFDIIARRAGRALPWPLRRHFRLVADSEIDAVLDASGFAYSDQWGPTAIARLAQRAERMARRGARLVLLPQALGPFDTAEGRAAFRRVLEAGALVFARDQASYEHARACGGPSNALRRAPDFTCLIKGRPSLKFRPRGPYACVVPNVRMTDKVPGLETGAYIEALAAAIEALQEHDLEPVLVPHDQPGDLELSRQLAERFGELRVVVEPDPVSLKGIVRDAAILVGSRFHALVSALTQAVPAVGSSWSHKYQALFADYGCAELLATKLDARDAMATRVHQALAQDSDGGLREKLGAAANEQRAMSEGMWAEVFARLGVSPGQPGLRAVT